MAGTVIYEAHPAMFRAHPFWFVLCVLLIALFGIGIIMMRDTALIAVMIAAFGVGIIILVYWYTKTRATALTVTDSDLLYVRGILSKDRTSMSLKHVRSVSIAQGFIDRILGVGTIQISTAGDEPEFTIVDMPDPQVIQQAIAKAQGMRSDKA
jgi:uncharacterized membrane protein YdbT with pleckstrin-like domain